MSFPPTTASNTQLSCFCTSPRKVGPFFLASEVDLRYPEANHVSCSAVSGEIIWAMASTSNSPNKKPRGNEKLWMIQREYDCNLNIFYVYIYMCIYIYVFMQLGRLGSLTLIATREIKSNRVKRSSAQCLSEQPRLESKPKPEKNWWLSISWVT